MKFKDLISVLKETVSEWSEDKAPRLAAALSYYTIFSLAPLLVIAIAVAGFFLGNSSVQDQVMAQITGLIGDSGRTMVQSMIDSTRNTGAGIFATIFGLVTLIFGAAGVFGQLHEALNTIWEVASKPGGGILHLVKERFLSFTMVLGIGFLLLVSLVLSTALSVIGKYFSGLFPGYDLVFQIINFLVSLGVITLLFALIYKVLPDAEIAWKDVWLGAAVTSLLFTIGKLLIGLYLGRSSVTSAYGAAGSLVLILLWVYYSAQILFFGAEFTQVYANKFGSRVTPEEGAIALTEEARAQQGIPHKENVEQAAARGGSAARPVTTGAGSRRPSVLPATGSASYSPTALTAEERRISNRLDQHPSNDYPAHAIKTDRADVPELLPEAQPSMLALSAIVAMLLGFMSGFLVRSRR